MTELTSDVSRDEVESSEHKDEHCMILLLVGSNQQVPDQASYRHWSMGGLYSGQLCVNEVINKRVYGNSASAQEFSGV